MNASDLAPCPFCGCEWNWRIKASIGSRMVEGYAECQGCGARVGEGRIALDDDDLKSRIVAIVNARHERTCEVTDFVNFDGGHEPGNPVICDGYHILSCGHKCPGNWYEQPNYCPVCDARVVEQ